LFAGTNYGAKDPGVIVELNRIFDRVEELLQKTQDFKRSTPVTDKLDQELAATLAEDDDGAPKDFETTEGSRGRPKGR
jgi:hypothetical protein